MSEARRHRHLFTSLWWHFGPHGPQDVHVHSCIRDDDCHRVLVGPGRDCQPHDEKHNRNTLTADGPPPMAAVRSGAADV